MKTRSFKFDLKSLSEEGQFAGYLSVFGNKDFQNEVVAKGAFSRTLKHWSDSGRSIPVLWQHDMRSPIGVFNSLTEDQKGLSVEGTLAVKQNVPDADRAYSLMKMGALGGLSIGHDTIKDDYKDGVRYLKEIKLYEGSIVTFPANDLCVYTHVKAAWMDNLLSERKFSDFAQCLEEITDGNELYRLRDDILSAFSGVMYNAMYDGDGSTDEKMQTINDSADQLKDALVSWAGRLYQIDPSGKSTRGKEEKELTAEWIQRATLLRDNLNVLLETPADAENSSSADPGPDAKEDDENESDPENSLPSQLSELTDLLRSSLADIRGDSNGSEGI
jgi:HK97 family phage prohead protease